jgi:dipeptidyl aminopeptidase/acylaminoacyl peptidase
MAQRFDVGRLELEGDATAVEPVATNLGNGGAAFSVSREGSLAYRSSAGLRGPYALRWIDRQGTQQRAVSIPNLTDVQHTLQFDLSPDDRHLLILARSEPGIARTGDLWIVDLTRPSATRVTIGAEVAHARWSRDGEYVYFDSFRDGTPGVYRRRTDGAFPEEVVWKGTGQLFDVAVDGRLLISTGAQTAPGLQRYCVLIAATDTRPTFADSERVECGRLSADGNWIAYDRRGARTELAEVYVAPFPAGAPRVQVSTGGGFDPRWRADGHELFYTSPDRRTTMAADVTFHPALRASLPARLVTQEQISGLTATKDGLRLLVAQRTDVPQNTLTVVARWNATLK